MWNIKASAEEVSPTLPSPPVFATHQCRVSFTRDGKEEGSWDLHEERSQEHQEDGNVHGLEGDHDLLAAMGYYGAVQFDTRFRKIDFLFTPPMRPSSSYNHDV